MDLVSVSCLRVSYSFNDPNYYRFGSTARLQVFLIASTCLLYLVAAGLVARSVSYFEQQHWNTLVGKDVGELGDGPGSYDIHRSVWHVDVRNLAQICFLSANLSKCCSPEFNGGGGWGIFNGILGWTNSATYSSVISYNIYWILVIASFLTMRYHEVRGHWPLMRPQNPSRVESNDVDSAQQGVATSIETDTVENGQVKEKAIIKENTTIVSVLQAISPN
jgi:high-affinity iron transporter